MNRRVGLPLSRPPPFTVALARDEPPCWLDGVIHAAGARFGDTSVSVVAVSEPRGASGRPSESQHVAGTLSEQVPTTPELHGPSMRGDAGA